MAEMESASPGDCLDSILSLIFLIAKWLLPLVGRWVCKMSCDEIQSHGFC